MEKRIAEAFPNGTNFLFVLHSFDLTRSLDPPIKRFAQRYGYVGIDTVANRDLGFGYRPPTTITTSGASASTSKIESPNASHNNSAISAERKRGPSPDRRRDEERKRQRPLSPPPPPRDRDRDRDRDYREGPPRRRFSPPPPRDWERRERDELAEKQVTVPPVLSGFLGQLPPASTFNGKLSIPPLDLSLTRFQARVSVLTISCLCSVVLSFPRQDPKRSPLHHLLEAPRPVSHYCMTSRLVAN
jgi:hypothetical protein